MDFDKPKVYGDTFISDGLVYKIMIIMTLKLREYMEVSLQLTPQGLALMFGSTVNRFTSSWHEAQLHITIQNPHTNTFYTYYIIHTQAEVEI